MHEPITAGNWGMNKTTSEAKGFAETVKNKVPSNDKVDSAIGSPALFLQELMTSAGGTELKISTQNCYWENSGTFTGETLPAALADLGVHHVIIGHSERRECFHEIGEDINKKTKAISADGVTPILCCGGSLETYETGKTTEWIEGQITAGSADLSVEQVSDMVITYEPIWAIGTGKSADAQIANEICGVVRQTVEKLYGEEVSEAVHIQYGGSVKPENIVEYMAKENANSVLVDGINLQADSFLLLLGAVK